MQTTLVINPSAATVGDAVNNLATIISTLYGIGARQFLVPNLPDLSLTPYGLSLSPVERAGTAGALIGFNAGLAGAVTGLSFLPDIDIELFDTFDMFNAILANPAAFGFSTTSTPCVTGDLQDGGSVCADPSLYVFWDSVHPTTAAHQVLGNAFAAAVAEPVPEPAQRLACAAQPRHRSGRRGAPPPRVVATSPASCSGAPAALCGAR